MEPQGGELCRIGKNRLRFFHFLDEEDAYLLSDYFTCFGAVANEVIWREGEEETYVAFLTSGKLEETKSTEFADKQLVTGVYTEGAILGELGILLDRHRGFTVVALEDSDLLILSRENFDRLTLEHPEVGVKLLKGMLFAVSTRLRKSFERLASIF